MNMELLGNDMGVLWGSSGDLSALLPPFELPFNVSGEDSGPAWDTCGHPRGDWAAVGDKSRTKKASSQRKLCARPWIRLSNRENSFLNLRRSCGSDRFSLHLTLTCCTLKTRRFPFYVWQVSAEARFCCYFYCFRRVQVNKGNMSAEGSPNPSMTCCGIKAGPK